MAHELAHIFYKKLADKNSYDRAAEWERRQIENKIYLQANRPMKNFVELGGLKSPEEDFAKNLEYFIYDPKKLKQITPKVYEWMQKTFGAKLLKSGIKK